MPRVTKNAPANCLQLKVTLREVEPPVWRRIVVPADFTLGELHMALQVAMGWTDSHLHQFRVGKVCYGALYPELEDELSCEDEETITLQQVAKKAKTFLYEYDFGDGWTHEVKVEKAPNPEGHLPHAVCMEGARACPPEDVGGPWCYEDFLASLVDPKHKMHQEYTEWIGGFFDPEAFSVAKVNARLKRMR